jgi:hypothetical protein
MVGVLAMPDESDFFATYSRDRLEGELRGHLEDAYDRIDQLIAFGALGDDLLERRKELLRDGLLRYLQQGQKK